MKDNNDKTVNDLLARYTKNKLKKESIPNTSLINDKATFKQICDSLLQQTNKYEPTTTIKLIEEYINSENKLNRILYSEISSYVFPLSDDAASSFQTNLESLLYYSIDEKKLLTEDVKKKYVLNYMIIPN